MYFWSVGAYFCGSTSLRLTLRGRLTNQTMFHKLKTLQNKYKTFVMLKRRNIYTVKNCDNANLADNNDEKKSELLLATRLSLLTIKF